MQDPAPRHAPRIAGPAPPETGSRAGLKRADSGFEAEFNAYRQERLRLCAGVLFVVALVLLGMHWVLAPPTSPSFPGFWRHASTYLHLAGILYVGGFHLLLKRGRWKGRALAWGDGILQGATVLSCALIYETSYEMGNRTLVPFLGLFLVTRAVVVPSRALRTFWGCLPAPLLILAIQLAHGRIVFWRWMPMPQDGYAELLTWDFTYLVLCSAVAVVASRVNFRLRVSAYEARQLDQYVLEGLIGRGAMGEVYRAHHALMRRPTAIKMVRSDVLTPAMLARFEQEVRQTARLTHPNTIRVYDYGQTADGVFYYAMELLEGTDLERLVATQGPLAPARVVHVLAQAAGALAEAHSIGLVHRDVKPSNLLLCRQGLEDDVVKVMDFGLVRDTAREGGSFSAPDEICGSPETIAPEVVRGEPATPASDLYGLGAVGCFLLTGKPIFDARNALDFVRAHVDAPPIRPSARGVAVPPALEALLLSCLAKDPALRPASAAALRHALLALE